MLAGKTDASAGQVETHDVGAQFSCVEQIRAQSAAHFEHAFASELAKIYRSVDEFLGTGAELTDLLKKTGVSNGFFRGEGAAGLIVPEPGNMFF